MSFKQKRMTINTIEKSEEVLPWWVLVTSKILYISI